MRGWALSSLIASEAPGAGNFTPFPAGRTLPIRNHKASSNSDKFTKNFTLLDLDRESRADSCKAIRPSAGGAAGAKSRRFLARRGVKEALDDQACRPLRTDHTAA